MPTKNTTPSMRLTESSRINTYATSEIAMSSGMSNLSSRCSIDSPLIAADKPRIARMLKVLLPTTLPMATSALPLSAPLTDTAISGALVPNATTVRPITMGATPSLAAIEEAPRTSHSAPKTRQTSPATSQTNVKKSTR